MKGLTIVDPTFGQIVDDLDKTIEENPDIFVGKILVADIEEVEKRFGIRYTLK